MHGLGDVGSKDPVPRPEVFESEDRMVCKRKVSFNEADSEDSQLRPEELETKMSLPRVGRSIMSEFERLKFWIRLLEMEVQALRSVLSEFDGDKLEYLQMQKANAIAELKNHLVHP